MSNANDSNRKIAPRSGGFFSDIANRFRLVGRLMADGRVNPFLKVLPVGTLVYLVMPDLVPFVFDDALIIWLGTTLFVELCPPAVVDEHLQLLSGVIPGNMQNPRNPSPANDVVDGEFFEVDPKRTNRP